MDLSHLGGWVYRPRDIEAVMKQLPYPVFSDIWTPIKGTGRGKIVVLTDIIEQVAGKFETRVQTVGDCVSMGYALGIDVAKAVDIFIKGDFEEWIAETSTEEIYGGGRIVIGKGGIGYSDGCVGAWAAKFVNQYGALPRGKYGNVDTTKYSGERARLWGRPNAGPPASLVEECKKHPISVTSLVKTAEEARDLIANGYPISVCSNQGFSNKRDSEGFAVAQGSWAHCMCVVGVRDDNRPGFLIQNSWPKTWIAGPKKYNQAEGSFWVDFETFERRMLSQNDSWALSGYTGFEPKELNTRII